MSRAVFNTYWSVWQAKKLIKKEKKKRTGSDFWEWPDVSLIAGSKVFQTLSQGFLTFFFYTNLSLCLSNQEEMGFA